MAATDPAREHAEDAWDEVRDEQAQRREERPGEDPRDAVERSGAPGDDEPGGERGRAEDDGEERGSDYVLTRRQGPAV